MTIVWALVAGGLVGSGLFLAAAAIADQLPRLRRPRMRVSIRVVALCAVLAVVWLATQWVAALVVVAVGWWLLPNVFAGQSATRAEAARSEAIARWTELLRDNLAAGVGLEQAITVTASAAPGAIAAEVERLADRLEQMSLPRAVRMFGAELADPASDLVVAALVTATTHQTSRLAPLLGELSRSTRDAARMRERVVASRASTWQAVRTITAAVIVFVGALAVLTQGWLAPYRSLVGQLWLLLVGAGFISGLVWLHRLAELTATPRTLVREDT